MMGIVVRVDTGKTGHVEHWLHMWDQMALKAYIECTAKYAEEKGYGYPDDGPIFVNQKPDENGNLKPWAGKDGKRAPKFTLFEGKISV